MLQLTPPSRLLKETGRLSNSPVFIVGIYSGADKLGEGFGSSLRMAEYRVRSMTGVITLVLITFSGSGRLPPPAVPHTTPTRAHSSTHYHISFYHKRHLRRQWPVRGIHPWVNWGERGCVRMEWQGTAGCWRERIALAWWRQCI